MWGRTEVEVRREWYKWKWMAGYSESTIRKVVEEFIGWEEEGESD